MDHYGGCLGLTCEEERNVTRHFERTVIFRSLILEHMEDILIGMLLVSVN